MLRPGHWLAVDGVVTALLLVVSVTGAVGRTPALGLPSWLAPVLVALVAAPVAVRRLRPVTVFAVVLAANTAATGLRVTGDPAFVVSPALYTVAVVLPPRRSGVLLAAATVLTTVVGVLAQLAPPTHSPWTGPLYLVAVSDTVLAAASRPASPGG